jgi:hypothetical protein
MLNLNSIMIGTKQPKVLAAYYQNVLGRPAEMVDEEFGFYSWQAGAAYFSVMDHSEMGGRAKDPGRVLINFETPQVKEEFEESKPWEAQSSGNPMKWKVGGSQPWQTRTVITSNCPMG